MKNDEKNTAAASHNEVLEEVARGRDMFDSEDEYFEFIYQKLEEIGGLTEDEMDNMAAYLLCIVAMREDAPPFYYDMKTDYRVTWEKLTHTKWENPCKPAEQEA